MGQKASSSWHMSKKTPARPSEPAPLLYLKYLRVGCQAQRCRDASQVRHHVGSGMSDMRHYSPVFRDKAPPVAEECLYFRFPTVSGMINEVDEEKEPETS